MANVPSALLKIHRLPDGVICLLRELAGGKTDPVQATLAILTSDENWLREVSLFFPLISTIPEKDLVPTFEGRHLAEIAVATALRRYMKIGLVSELLSRYWKYSLACAIACSELSRCTTQNNALAFSCGMLHDLGRVALMTAYPEQYVNLFAASERLLGRNELINVSEQERLLFGFDRFQTGEWLVDQWGLPPFLSQIVGKFQSAAASADTDLIALTRAGCSLAYSLGYGMMLGAPRKSIQDLKSVLPPLALDRFGSNLNVLKNIIDQTFVHWREFPV
jgi:hypothetical protein